MITKENVLKYAKKLEGITYNRELTDEDKRKLVIYLNDKWASEAISKINLSIESKPMGDIQETLLERESTHGNYPVQAEFSQDFKEQLRAHRNWESLSHAQRESLELICMKISRIMHGNPKEPDHWQDIAGYATLVVNDLEMNKDRVERRVKNLPIQAERRA